ncbi:MAG TPA: efflux RND transporter periplasmic adaptor subunit [Sedimentisphaerales bacterium]|nr:efflux RND transporter periplasmic adaptor subunit [Sedimentisphaerales bacterium]
MKKSLLLLLVLTMAAAAGWQLYRRVTSSAVQKGPGRSAGSVAVETKLITTGVIRDIGVFTGSLQAKSQFIVAPKVAGWLKEILVNIGDPVSRNQIIAVLDDEEFTQQVEQAGAELQVAKANAENCATDLDIARREYERAKALREKQIASASELDASEAAFNACQTRYKVSVAQVDQKESAMKAADLRLSYATVRAFWEDGDQTRVVGERFVDEGTLLQANQPVVSILDNDPLTAVVFVIERDYPKVTVGHQALIATDAYPGRTFAGTIVRMAPLLRENSRQARVELQVPNPEHLLKPGMFVRVEVEFARHESATLVPITALVKRAGRQGVFVVDIGNLKAHFVAVTTGIIDGELAEVAEPDVSGLVVTMGNHLLEDGSDILPPVRQAAPGGSPAANADSNAAAINQPSGDSR